MGVDGLDLMFQLERRYGVELPADTFQGTRTVSDVTAVVLAHLRGTSEISRPIKRAFFETRTRIVETLGCEPRDIRPSTPLSSILPPPWAWMARRRAWAGIARNSRRAPDMEVWPRWRLLTDVAAITFIVVSTGAAMILGRILAGGPGLVGLIFGVVTLVLAWLFMDNVLLMPFTTALPSGVETVGDLAKRLAPAKVRNINTADRADMEAGVLADIREILADITRTPIEKIHPDSDLFKDLGFS